VTPLGTLEHVAIARGALLERDRETPRWNGDLLAIDPSVRSPGAALFRHGVLIACDRVKIDAEIHALEGGARWLRVAQEITSWYADIIAFQGAAHLCTVIYECPQWYAEGKGKGDPNQLAGVVGVGQSVAVLMHERCVAAEVHGPEILSPLPAEWTGQLPKATSGNPWKSPRGERISSRLHDAERRLVPAQHDAIDSLGLGLWALGRYERRRVFPGTEE
jgi:hypothetical protein